MAAPHLNVTRTFAETMLRNDPETPTSHAPPKVEPPGFSILWHVGVWGNRRGCVSGLYPGNPSVVEVPNSSPPFRVVAPSGTTPGAGATAPNFAVGRNFGFVFRRRIRKKTGGPERSPKPRKVVASRFRTHFAYFSNNTASGRLFPTGRPPEARLSWCLEARRS